MSSELALNASAEDADGQVREVVLRLELADDVQRQTLVDQHRRVAEREVVVVERGQLHRVLEQARPGREAGTGHVRGARVVLREALADALEVQPAVCWRS